MLIDLTWTLFVDQRLTCSQCILQWTYKAGNNWGVCNNGTGALGCGNQVRKMADDDSHKVDDQRNTQQAQHCKRLECRVMSLGWTGPAAILLFFLSYFLWDQNWEMAKNHPTKQSFIAGGVQLILEFIIILTQITYLPATGCSGKIVFFHNSLQPLPRLHRYTKFNEHPVF